MESSLAVEESESRLERELCSRGLILAEVTGLWQNDMMEILAAHVPAIEVDGTFWVVDL